MTTPAQSPLITAAELGSYGAGTDFRAQFTIRALQLAITTTGALGTMKFTWAFLGDELVSEPIQSEAGAPWEIQLPDPSWCTLTFADGTYTSGQTFVVSRTGAVTGPSALITATRENVIADMIAEVTSEAVTDMQPRVVPPVLTPGAAVKGAIGRIVVYRLKSRVGMTPGDAGTGDGNIIMLADQAKKFLVGIGASAMRPPDLIDSSANNLGAGLSALPVSDPQRGWND